MNNNSISEAVRLIADLEMLHTPFSAIVDDMNRHHFEEWGKTNPWGNGGPDNPVCLVQHSGGDHDVVPWPMTKPEHRQWLASSLFDARECGLIPDVASVELPDGSTFVIDREAV